MNDVSFEWLNNSNGLDGLDDLNGLYDLNLVLAKRRKYEKKTNED